MQLIENTEDNYTNDQIFSGIKNKDRKVLEFIYKKYYPMILDYILKNSGEPEDAKDIFNDALTTLYEKSKNGPIEIKSSFKTYLYAICKNLWLMILRRRKTATKVNEDSNFLTQSEDNIENDIMNHLKYKVFRKHFKTLGEDCQVVLEMFFKGHSLREIGEELGFTESYAKKKKFTCQKNLIQFIESDELYDELRSE